MRRGGMARPQGRTGSKASLLSSGGGCRATMMLLALAPGWLALSDAAIHGYKGDLFTDAGYGAFVFRGGREGMFASSGQEQNGMHVVQRQVSDGRSFIRLAKVEFHRNPKVAGKYRDLDGDTGLVEVLVFEVGERDLIGHVMDDGSRRFCCTADLAPKIRCKENHLIVKEHAEGGKNTPWLTEVWFQGNSTEAHAPPTTLLPITTTGMYHLWFVTCNPELKDMKVEGLTTWKNPHGYLPGMMVANLYFYGYTALATLAIAFLWAALYVVHWKEIIPLQNCITALIGLSMIEMGTWYFDYVNFNVTGFRPYVTTLWAVFMGSLRKALSRMLVLVVSMGYGVVRPTLGGYTNQVLAIGASYFAAVVCLDMVTHVGTIDDLPSMLRVVLVLPVAILDAIFILWIFTALSRTLSQLASRRQAEKLNLYRSFTNTLAFAVWISFCWIAYEMYFKISDSTHTEKWQSYWVTDAFWQILTLAVLFIICVLWRPSQVSQCYAYVEAEDIDLDEPSEVEMQPTPKVNTDVFSIDDDAEGVEKMA